MADTGFLKHFITEPVYFIPGEESLLKKPAIETEEPSAKVEELSVAASEVKEPEATSADMPVGIVYKGTNSRKILILVDQPEEEYINAEDEQFLGKILSAIKLNIEEVGIANCATSGPLALSDLLEFEADKYLLFGVGNTGLLESSAGQYEIAVLAGGKHGLNCASLAEIARDPAQKKLLWSALQKMFL